MPVFGGGWFGFKAEQFARFFGTPTFLLAQTVIVGRFSVANTPRESHSPVRVTLQIDVHLIDVKKHHALD